MCRWTDGITIASPTAFHAVGKINTGPYWFELWVDGRKLYTINNSTRISTTLSLLPGTHRVTLHLRNSTGSEHYVKSLRVNVAACGAPAPDGIAVCKPAPNMTYSSPIAVQAASNIVGGVYRFELWSGGVKLFSVSNNNYMAPTITLPSGTQTLSFVARNASLSRVARYALTITIGGAPPPPPPAPRQVEMTWDPSTSTVDGYRVYRATRSGGPYQLLSGSLLPGTSYVDQSVTPATTYYYVVTAVASSGMESSYSNEAVAVIP